MTVDPKERLSRRATWLSVLLVLALVGTMVVGIGISHRRSYLARRLLHKEGVAFQWPGVQPPPQSLLAWLAYGDDSYQQVGRLTFKKVTLTRQELSCLQHFPNLTECFFVQCPHTPEIVAQASKIKSLRFLQISEGRLTHGDLSSLRQHAELEHLVLSGVALDQVDLAVLVEIPGLRELSIDGATLGAEQLASLAQCQGLTSLSLDGTTLPEQGLGCLQTLDQLQSLVLRDSNLTNARLGELKSLPRLKYLQLSGTSVDDESLPHLKGFPALEEVVAYSTRVTSSGVAALQQSHPKLIVNSEFEDLPEGLFPNDDRLQE